MPRNPLLRQISERDRAFLAFGKAMAAWASLEKGLYGWFEHITLIDMRQAQRLYFTATSFKAGTDLIRAAQDVYHVEDDENEFLKAALGVATHYSSFRNKLAHGEFTFEGLIIESKHADRSAAEKNAITHPQLEKAAACFQELATLLWKARDIALGFMPEDEPEASLEKCTEEVADLPRLQKR